MQACKLKPSSAAILAACLALAASTATAADSPITGTIAVTASVSASCTMTTADMSFGTYDPLNANNAGGADVTATGSVTTTCTNGATPVLTLSEGAHPDSTSAPATPKRQMLNGTDSTALMSYGLYSDDAGQILIGNTADTGLAIASDGTAKTTNIYGIIPKGQNVTVGSYSDSVTATLTF